MIRRQGENADDFTLEGLADGEEVESAYAVDNIARTLGALTADDVAPLDDWRSAERFVSATVDTVGGTRAHLEFHPRDDKIYLRLRAETPSDDADAEPSANEPTTSLSDRWRKWAYVVPQYQFDAITRKRSELVKSTTQQTGVVPEPSK